MAEKVLHASRFMSYAHSDMMFLTRTMETYETYNPATWTCVTDSTDSTDLGIWWVCETGPEIQRLIKLLLASDGRARPDQNSTAVQ